MKGLAFILVYLMIFLGAATYYLFFDGDHDHVIVVEKVKMPEDWQAYEPPEK